jgi:hypothetical protein
LKFSATERICPHFGLKHYDKVASIADGSLQVFGIRKGALVGYLS